MTKTETFVVTGADKIYCEGCESRIQASLKRMAGVRQVQARRNTQVVEVQFDPAKISEWALRTRLAELGYVVEVDAG